MNVREMITGAKFMDADFECDRFKIRFDMSEDLRLAIYRALQAQRRRVEQNEFEIEGKTFMDFFYLCDGDFNISCHYDGGEWFTDDDGALCAGYMKEEVMPDDGSFDGITYVIPSDAWLKPVFALRTFLKLAEGELV